MALYFFHLVDGADLLLDPDGREIDPGSVHAAALAEARAMIAADARVGHAASVGNAPVERRVLIF